MTEAEADRRAEELNEHLGAVGDETAFYVPVRAGDGSWDVEKRRSKPGLLERIIDVIPP